MTRPITLQDAQGKGSRPRGRATSAPPSYRPKRRRIIRHPVRTALIAVAVIAAGAGATTLLPDGRSTSPVSEAKAAVKRGTGLPLPRFVSLKSSKINVRRGPGQDYEVDFTYLRAGLPVEIVQEFDNWRKVRDADGDEGWVFHSLLSGRRTAIVAPWEKTAQIPARRSGDPAAHVSAYFEPGVRADVETCTGGWCLLSGENYSGWMEQDKLWGVYPDEEVDG